MKKLTMKQKVIGIGILSLISITIALFNNNNLKKATNESTVNINENKIGNDTEIETKESDIIESDITPSYSNDKDKPIWIKNIVFLSDKEENYNTIMLLKSKLNSELKTINKEIYEVELLEDTYKKTEKGFEVEAKADKLDGKMFIEYNDYEYIFTIVN